MPRTCRRCARRSAGDRLRLVGRRPARSRGRTGGQKPKLRPHQVTLAREVHDELGEDGKRRYTVVTQIAAEFGVTRPTIYRHLAQTPAAGCEVVNGRAGAEFAEHAGRRVRVLDRHMYRIQSSTMRLQLFTAPGLRPVAVVAQTIGEGCSLVNGADSFASHVWHSHVPDEALPPLWVQRLMLSPDVGEALELVRFDVEPGRTLSSPRWLPITPAQLDRLVGAAVDLTRGRGFVPPPPEPQYRARWVLMSLSAMPGTTPFRASCMTGAAPQARAPWRRLIPARLAAPAVSRLACCWYHGGDWQRVHDIVARLLPTAEAEAPDDIAGHVIAAARAEHLTQWTRQALHSLFAFPISVEPSDGSEPAVFVNGQHRVQAMRDAGLTHTFVEHDEVAENPAPSSEA